MLHLAVLGQPRNKVKERLLVVHRLGVLQFVQKVQFEAKRALLVVACVHVVADEQHHFEQLVEAVVVA